MNFLCKYEAWDIPVRQNQETSIVLRFSSNRVNRAVTTRQQRLCMYTNTDVACQLLKSGHSKILFLTVISIRVLFIMVI